MNCKKIISSFLTAAILVSASALNTFTVFADMPSEITADKTAQWYANSGETANYDLRIHGWSSWETAAYIGFTLPDNFDGSSIEKAELVLDTKSVNASSEAYLYSADYGDFENNTQHEGSDAPSYTSAEILSFTSPAGAGEFRLDITNYINTISDADNLAFRIDVKSQNSNNSWVIGSCNNGGAAPKLVFGVDDNVIKNASFANDDEGWTISDKSHMSVSDGKLRASGENYESRISQTVNGMENGIYTLNAYVTNDSTDGICYLYAKSKGHTMVSTSVPVSKTETKVTVPGIIVEDGKCDIGLYINGSQTLTLDTLSFTKSEETRVPFLKGGEISKLTYVEDMGGKFFDADGNEGDALQIMAENGFNLARIRLLDNPGKGHGEPDYYLPAGYMTEEDCLSMARRAKDKGMQILFSFAYSDYWVDGEKQYIPNRWQAEIDAQGLSGENLYKYLEDKTYSYTKNIMQKLIAQGTCPEYVSIGNEIQVGIYFGNQKTKDKFISGLYNNADMLTRFLKAGAKAVRETSPETKIVLHSDNGGKLSSRNTFKNTLSKMGNDFDVIGVSYYPFYNKDVSIDTVVNEFNSLINTYNKDVIIMETGYNWTEFKPGGEWDGQLMDSGYYQDIYGETQSGQRAFLTELYSKLRQTLGGRCIGDLYWDPVMIHSKDWKIGWAIRESDDVTDSNVVPNSTIFDFDGKAVEGQKAMKYNTNATDKVMITGVVKNGNALCRERQITVNVNGADYTVTTDKYGKYIAAVPYPSNETLTVYANGFAENYSKDAPYDGVLVKDVDFSAVEDKIISVNALDDNGSISYTVNYTTSNKDAKLFVALYSDGVLKECSINKKDGQFKKPSSDYTVKAFLWDGLSPLCEAVSNK